VLSVGLVSAVSAIAPVVDTSSEERLLVERSVAEPSSAWLVLAVAREVEEVVSVASEDVEDDEAEEEEVEEEEVEEEDLRDTDASRSDFSSGTGI
jgi:hypothetical protein